MKKKKVLVLFLVLTFMISTTVSISAESYRLWLASHVQQAKSNWCWAACAQMMGEHYNMSGYKNQYQVAYQIQGNYDDDRTDADGLEDMITIGLGLMK